MCAIPDLIRDLCNNKLKKLNNVYARAIPGMRIRELAI